MENKMNTRKHRMKCIDIYKTSKGCCICGYNKSPRALCFDHLPEYNKSEICKNGYSRGSYAGGMHRFYAAKYDPKELIDEIKKCRILCHNCHMENTFEQRVYSKSDFSEMSLNELNFILQSTNNLETLLYEKSLELNLDNDDTYCIIEV